MSKLVRAKHPNGAEFTTSEAHAKRNGLTITDKPTTSPWGRPLPAKTAPLHDPARMSRAELEGEAARAGVTPDTVRTAKTKADLAAAITNQSAVPAGTAPASEETAR